MHPSTRYWIRTSVCSRRRSRPEPLDEAGNVDRVGFEPTSYVAVIWFPPRIALPVELPALLLLFYAFHRVVLTCTLLEYLVHERSLLGLPHEFVFFPREIQLLGGDTPEGALELFGIEHGR